MGTAGWGAPSATAAPAEAEASSGATRGRTLGAALSLGAALLSPAASPRASPVPGGALSLAAPPASLDVLSPAGFAPSREEDSAA